MTDNVLASSLVLNYEIYPRHEVDETNIRDIVQAMQAGAVLPPIVADRKTRIVVDGFHRVRAAQRLHGAAQAMVDAEFAAYPDEAAMFEDAIRRNAGHGRKLTPYDKARCIVRAEELRLDPERVYRAMAVTRERYDVLQARKIAVFDGRRMAIKHTLASLAGEDLSSEQAEGNRRATGMAPLVYVNQVINVLEHDLWDRDDARISERLRYLGGLLSEKLAVPM